MSAPEWRWHDTQLSAPCTVCGEAIPPGNRVWSHWIDGVSDGDEWICTTCRILEGDGPARLDPEVPPPSAPVLSRPRRRHPVLTAVAVGAAALMIWHPSLGSAPGHPTCPAGSHWGPNMAMCEYPDPTVTTTLPPAFSTIVTTPTKPTHQLSPAQLRTLYRNVPDVVVTAP